MKFAFFTMQYSVFFLKTNFIFMVILQVVKFMLNKENRSSPSPDLFTNSVNATVNSNDSPPDTTYVKMFTTSLKDFVVSFVSTFSYDVKQLEATKTEIINVMKVNNKENSLLQDEAYNVMPTIVSESYVNFSELLQFSNLNHVIKLTYLFNMNLNCVLLNLALISYLLIRLKKNKQLREVGTCFSKKFLKLNLFAANFAFLVLITIDSIYMLFLKSSFNMQTTTSDTNALFDSLYSYLKDSEPKQQPLDLLGETDNAQVASSKDYVSIESSFSTSQSSNFYSSEYSSADVVLTAIALKTNIVILVVAICTLAFYSHLVKIDLEDECEKSSASTKSGTFFFLYKLTNI